MTGIFILQVMPVVLSHVKTGVSAQPLVKTLMNVTVHELDIMAKTAQHVCENALCRFC